MPRLPIVTVYKESVNIIYCCFPPRWRIIANMDVLA